MALIDQTQLSNLRELAAGDTSFLVSVIDAFLPQLKDVPSALRVALNDGESKSMVELAHSLKGSAGNVGAEDVYELCQSIERLARDGQMEPMSDLVESLEVAAAATHEAFQAEKARFAT